mgnify:CR=1 FL=1
MSLMSDLGLAIKSKLDTKANINNPVFTGSVTLPSTTQIGTLTSTTIGYLDGITGNIQTQINSKLSSTGTAATATKLATARTIQTNLGSAGGASFDGTANVTPGVTGTLAVLNGGTGATTAAGALANIVGYTPIQQGGGTSQGTNKVYIGWGSNALNLQVDSTNFVSTWPISISGTAATATTASTVTINYNNDSNSTYQMLWGSGISVYATAGITCNPSTDYIYSTSISCSSWFRSTGATGWFNETYGGGIYMDDATYVKVYNGKSFLVPGAIVANGGITVGNGTTNSSLTMYDSDEGSRTLHCNSNRIGFLTQSGSWGSYCNDDGSWVSDVSMTAPIFYGQSTSARFADLAEKYSMDIVYEEGDVIQVGSDIDAEGTLYNGGKLLGVISIQPGLMINSEADGQYIALKGKVPVKCVSDVKKGQYLIADKDGKAKPADEIMSFFEQSRLIGVALEDSKDGKVMVKI